MLSFCLICDIIRRSLLHDMNTFILHYYQIFGREACLGLLRMVTAWNRTTNLLIKVTWIDTFTNSASPINPQTHTHKHQATNLHELHKGKHLRNGVHWFLKEHVFDDADPGFPLSGPHTQRDAQQEQQQQETGQSSHQCHVGDGQTRRGGIRTTRSLVAIRAPG